MKMSSFIEKEITENKLSKMLVDEMIKISTDIEFIEGVLAFTENDEDKITLLEYIKKGEDVNFEQIILNALWLYQQREKENN